MERVKPGVHRFWRRKKESSLSVRVDWAEVVMVDRMSNKTVGVLMVGRYEVLPDARVRGGNSERAGGVGIADKGCIEIGRSAAGAAVKWLMQSAVGIGIFLGPVKLCSPTTSRPHFATSSVAGSTASSIFSVSPWAW